MLLRVLRRFAASHPPHTLIRMPALSPTMTQGNIGAWRKQEGDALSVGDVLVEIETDKAQMDFESPEDGFLAKILLGEGEKEVQVSKPLAIIVDDKKLIPAFKDFKADPSESTKSDDSAAGAPVNGHTDAPAEVQSNEGQSNSAPAPLASDQRNDARIKASPLAKLLAKQQNVNLHSIHGSGPAGRIVKEDVTKWNGGSVAESIRLEDRVKYKDLELSLMRKTIASRLAHSMQSIPHYYLTLDRISMTMVLRARAQLNAQISGSPKLSINDFIIKAAAMALKSVPQVNSSWMGDRIRQYDTVDVCMAVATPTGLYTPIIKDAHELGLLQVAALSRSLAEKAKAGKLAPLEYQGGTFTVSNLGMFGISHFTAIINPPQAAILAVGRNDEQEKMAVTLSCDHRVIDGATGAQWLSVFRQFLEEPFKLLL